MITFGWAYEFIREMQYIVVVKIFPDFFLILGRYRDLMILFNVYNLQNIWTYGTFLALLKIRFMFNCRNRTVGFYEEKT
jgi:hypothetical protein